MITKAHHLLLLCSGGDTADNNNDSSQSNHAVDGMKCCYHLQAANRIDLR